MQAASQGIFRGSSEHLSERLGPSLSSFASASAVSSSAAPASSPSVPAVDAGPSTPSGSSPSSRSTASSWSPACSRSRSHLLSPSMRAAPARSPSVPGPSHHWFQSRSQHPSAGRRSPATRSPSRATPSPCSSSAHSTSAHYGSACSLPDHSHVGSQRSPLLRCSCDRSALKPRSSAPSRSFSLSASLKTGSAIGDYQFPLDYCLRLSCFPSLLRSSDCK